MQKGNRWGYLFLYSGMNNKRDSMIRHVVFRILALIILLFIAIPIAMAQLDPARRCGTGDIGAILFFMGVNYLVWMIYLLAESFFLYRKHEIAKFKFNVIAALILPIFILVSFVFNLMD